ncbi:MAG: hypothetical protein LBO79_01175 [Zoogloeaceae bacterium]|nr:hypothetical protein [Zoogloeaceae bacterium]
MSVAAKALEDNSAVSEAVVAGNVVRAGAGSPHGGNVYNRSRFPIVGGVINGDRPFADSVITIKAGLKRADGMYRLHF